MQPKSRMLRNCNILLQIKELKLSMLYLLMLSCMMYLLNYLLFLVRMTSMLTKKSVKQAAVTCDVLNEFFTFFKYLC